MAQPLRKADFGKHVSLGLTVAALLLCLPMASFAQATLISLRHHKPAPANPPAAQPAVHASQPPAFSIPVEPLGFAAPGPIYQGQRMALASLDFLDEGRLLFTFRAPGLIHRDASGADQRQIRALVLSLPKGNVEDEDLWTLHGDSRYLWILHDGSFLLRDLNDLRQGNTNLDLKPLLHFPGPLLWLEMDPSQQYLVTDSHEPGQTASEPGQVPSPDTAAASVTTDGSDTSGEPNIVLRILRRSTGQVMLVSHVRTVVHLPINSDGYLEPLRGRGREWLLNMNYFTGGNRILGHVDSICTPTLQFLAPQEVIASTCNIDGTLSLSAISIDGLHLWDAPQPPIQVWPRLFFSAGGLRLARETLVVTHPIDAYTPLSFDDVKGQFVEVLDAATGKVALKASASPVLDGGGNVAISPSGRRVAILDAGAIQVYELPAPPPLSSREQSHPSR